MVMCHGLHIFWSKTLYLIVLSWNNDTHEGPLSVSFSVVEVDILLSLKIIKACDKRFSGHRYACNECDLTSLHLVQHQVAFPSRSFSTQCYFPKDEAFAGTGSQTRPVSDVLFVDPSRQHCAVRSIAAQFAWKVSAGVVSFV